MNAPRSFWVFILVLGVVLAAGGWYLTHRRAREATSDLPPGQEANIWSCRGGVFVEGDIADPLESVALCRGGQEVAVPERWRWADRTRELLFADVDAGPLEVRVRSAHRDVTRALPSTAARRAVLLQETDLELPESSPVGEVPDTALAFSSDGRWLAVGSASGQLKVLPLTAPEEGKGRVDLRIREGVVKALAFADFGADAEPLVLVAGEQSPDGFVYGYDVRNGGKELWRFRLADELETSRPAGHDSRAHFSLPGAYRILPLPGGDVVVLGLHSWRPDPQTPQALARIYRLDARTGAVCWRYPAAQPEPRSIAWLAASGDGARLACVATVPGAGKEAAREAAADLLTLDARTGAETGRVKVESLAAQPRTSSLQALALDADGAGGVLGCDDGLLWALDFDTASRPNLRWRLDLGTRLPGGRWLACAYRKDDATDAGGRSSPLDYGVLMFDLARPSAEADRPVCRYATEGPLSSRGCFSPHGRFLAVTEGPRPGSDKRSATRTYRVLLLH